GPDDLLRAVAGDLDVKLFDTYTVAFDCRCTREKVESALLGLGKDELAKIAREQPETEAKCDFCARRYLLSADDVRALSARF
ncbi:MAG TPA: Hsp33 family molecular chaperone HslO, partial [Xanthomonadales bacterium]|nr:Hsp33 family molecular chaperone HslO [Xanthomonadales bacterium]